MTKLEELSEKDQALVKAFEIGLEAYDREDKLYMEHLGLQEKRIKTMLGWKYDEEPLKLFKKAHKKWEDEIESLENELYGVYKKMGEAFEERQAFFEQLRKA